MSFRNVVESTAKWILCDRATGAAICGVYTQSIKDRLTNARWDVVPVSEYLDLYNKAAQS